MMVPVVVPRRQRQRRRRQLQSSLRLPSFVVLPLVLLLLLLLLGWLSVATAFSTSTSIGAHRLVSHQDAVQDVDEQQWQQPPMRQKTKTSTVTTTTSSTAPWRLALNIGREKEEPPPLAMMMMTSRMPTTWAQSGCRMPIVVLCDVSHTRIQLRSDTISFTSVDGAVVRPIFGGGLQLVPGASKRSKSNTNNNTQKNNLLSFELTFPEAMARRDVTIEAGTTLYCTGTYYTQDELNMLNQAYYEARNNVWTIDHELRALTQFDDGPPKRWNDVTKQWERRPNTKSNPLAVLQKQIQYRTALIKERQARARRPDPNSLSERGTIPGVDGAIYIVKEGLIKSSNSSSSGAVMGRWSMEPMITGQPQHRPAF